MSPLPRIVAALLACALLAAGLLLAACPTTRRGPGPRSSGYYGSGYGTPQQAMNVY